MVNTLCLADSHIKRKFLILFNQLLLLITGTENTSVISAENPGYSGCTVGSLLSISKIFLIVLCLNFVFGLIYLQLFLHTEESGSEFISVMV